MDDTLLLIEDEKLLGAELARHFRHGGWHVVHAETLAEARKHLIDDDLGPLVVLSDMSLPDGTALDLLEDVRGLSQNVGEWLFLTGYGTVADSVRALRLGAVDFLEKPCSTERLDLVIASAARGARAQRRLKEQSSQLVDAFSVDAFVGRSSAAKRTRELLRKLTQVPISALVIGGETGTGKGLVTRILHHCGRQASGPLIEVNCAALPRELLESELFGHEAGAFTGAKKRRRGLVEQANGGTLFLDEIAEMDLDLQSKLLKMIEDQRVRPLGSEREIEVDVQIISASNRDLSQRAKEGGFRSDLYHRLSVFDLTLPPLRTRPEDLEDLVPTIIEEFSVKSGRHIRVVPDEVWAALRAYRWPGNVRELRNVIERSVLLSDSDIFPMEWLQLQSRDSGDEVGEPTVEGNHIILPLDGSLSLEDMDRYIVSTALERADYNMSAAARTLGTTRQTLRYRAQKYGLTDSKSDSKSGSRP